MSVKTKAVPLTEGEMVKRLASRYAGDGGNGPAGTLVPQVRNAAGFDAKRTIDALGFHFWPSRGLLIDGFECKSSRSDWTRELANPEKADDFCRLVDRFYIVAGRSDIVKVDEVPPDWGLIVPSGEGMREVKPAVVLHADSPAVEAWAQQRSGGRYAAGPRPLPPAFSRSFLVAVVRQATRQVNAAPAEIQDAFRQGVQQGQERAQHSRKAYEPMYRELREQVSEFERALGYPIRGQNRFGLSDITPTEVGQTLRAILNGDAEVTALRNRLSSTAAQAQRLADDARTHLESLDAALAQEVQA